jgi:hypothetical protein
MASADGTKLAPGLLRPRSLRANLELGIGRLPSRRFPSKLCAALDVSRRLRVDRENLGISVIHFYVRLAASAPTVPGCRSSRHETRKGPAEVAA